MEDAKPDDSRSANPSMSSGEALSILRGGGWLFYREQSGKRVEAVFSSLDRSFFFVRARRGNVDGEWPFFGNGASSSGRHAQKLPREYKNDGSTMKV